jgi:hypothetical protein
VTPLDAGGHRIDVGADPSLLSTHLRRRLATGEALPGSVTIDGAVLLSDVVGFTTHIGAVSELGRRGLEEFTSGLAQYIDRLINLVVDRGGDILCIAGDSLLCFWEAGDGPDAMREAAAIAAMTALDIQAATHDRPLTIERTIQTRIGVAAGPLTLTAAGGTSGRWELLTHGDTIERVDEAERWCEPGFVTLDRLAADLLVGDASILPVHEGLYQIDTWFAPRHVDDHVDQAVHVDDVDDVAVGSGSDDPDLWALEFRRLSIALLRLPDLADVPPETAQRIIVDFQKTVDRYEGLSTVVTDNKGVRLLASFGTAGLAHEDDAARAIGATRTFAGLVSALGYSCSAGIATGLVLHGVTGNQVRRSRTLAGDVINIAARLSTTAVDEVLCDQETAVAARNHYSFSVMNPIRVKGRAEPVPVFEPSGAVGGRQRAPVTLRGRTAELSELLGVLDGRHEVAVVVGDAGVGKSALLAELVADAAQRDVRTLIARTDAIHRSTPFLAWAPILHDVLGGLPGGIRGDPDTYVEPARSLVGQELAPYVTILPSLLGGSSAGASTVSDEQRASVIPRLIAEIVAAGEQPTLLVVEDAHWADSASLAVLRELTASAAAPKVVVSTRTEGLDGVRELLDTDLTQRGLIVELGSLDATAVRDLMADRLGADDVPDALLEFVHHRVAGHPYFCEQLLRSLVESGTVRVEAGTVLVGEFDEATIPSTVEGVIMGRFDRLDTEAQRCLKAASVVGRRHHVGAVQACIADVDVAVVMDRVSIDGLVSATLPDWYEFQHEIARDVVYSLMTGQQRDELHRIVARHLTDLAFGPGPATIGEHWSRAGEHSAAAECFGRAALDALNAGSFAESISLLDRADELRVLGGIESDRAVAAEMALVRARSSYYLGLLVECRTELESVIAMFDIPMPVEAAEHAAEHAAIEARRATGAAASNDSADPEIDAMLFESYRFLVKVLYLLGEAAPPILTASLRGLMLADGLGRRLEGAAIQALVGGAYVLTGNVERYEFHSHAAIAVAESPEGAPVANHVWRMVAVARAGLGDWDGSLDASDRALAALDPAGRNRDSGIWQTRAAVHLCAGDVVRAPEAWARTGEIAERDGNQQLARWSRLDQIQTMLGLGDHVGASNLLTDTLVSFGRPSDPLGTIEQHYTVAMVRSAEGRHVEAVNAARNVIRIVDEAPPSGFHFVEFCAGALEVMVEAVAGASGEESERLGADLVAEIERGVDLLDDLGRVFPHVKPRVPMIRATLALATRRADGVEPLLRDAAALARERNLSYDAGRAAVLLATACPTAAIDRDELTAACRDLRRLGCRPWAELGDEALAVRSG